MEQPSLDTRFGKYVPIRFLTHWTLGERFIAMSDDAGPHDPPVIVDRLWDEFRRFHNIYEELDRIRRWILFSHPTMVNVIEVGIAGGRIFVVSEYFEGLPLETHLQRRDNGGAPLPQRQVLEIGVQLAQGLAALHSAQAGPWPLKLVHGGLGSTRILIDNRWRARMLAGWSTPLERRLAWATPPRAAAYQAPEYLWGHPRPDHRADLFSLGAVLYDALVGRFCPSGDPLSYVRRVLRRNAEEAGGFDTLPPPLAHLLKRLLSPDPERRPADAATVADTLRSFIETEYRVGMVPAGGQEVEPTAVPTTKISRPRAGAPAPAESAASPSPEPMTVPSTKAEPSPAAPERVPPEAPTGPSGAPEPADVPPDEPEEPDISIRLTTVVPAVGRPPAEPGQPQVAGDDTAARRGAPEEAVTPPPASSAESLWFGTPVPSDQAPKATAPEPTPSAEEAPGDTVEDAAAPAIAEPPVSEPESPEPVAEAVSAPAIEPQRAASEPDEPPRPEHTVQANASLSVEQEAPGAPEGAEVPPEPPVVEEPASPAESGAPSPQAAAEEEEEEPARPLALQEPLPTKPRGFLVYREASSQEYLFPLAGDVVTLGRSSNNTYQILSEIKASRSHCEFQYEKDASGKGRWLLIDRRSTNGTYVNGKPIDVYELKGREKINIGYTTFRFLLADEDGNPIDATPEKPRDESLETGELPLLRAALVLNEGTPNESRHEIKGEVFLIGSGPGNSLQIKGPKVAPSHCEIRIQDGLYVIEDHMSEHGTLVNGFLIDQLALEGGEEISVGDVTMRFVLF